LRYRDPGRPLAHLDAQVVRQCAQVAHLESFLHVFLERLELRVVAAGDDEIIDVDVGQ